MAISPKILWQEGMFLSPQHFQAWEHHWHDRLCNAIRSVSPYCFGVSGIRIDEDELAAGSFLLSACEGIMPDGLAFQIPQADPTPALREIGNRFPPSQERLEVFLCIQAHKADSANCMLDGNGADHPLRFSRASVGVLDENTGGNKREIAVARPNFKIAFGGENLDGTTHMKIAEIKRASSGSLALAEEYIPPCLTISASPRLMTLIRSLVDRLLGISTELSQQFSQKSASQYDFHARDMSNFALIQTINTHVPAFIHLHEQGNQHPESLYRAMARFAGALTTFSTQVSAKDIPPYRHQLLGATFGRMETMIQKLLGVSTSSKCVRVQLNKTGKSRHEAMLPAGAAENPIIYLALTSHVPASQMQNTIPQVTKIGAPEQLDALQSSALRGIPIAYAGRPHPAIPTKPGYEYFLLDGKSELWDKIKTSNRIGLLIPEEIPGLELELFIVKE